MIGTAINVLGILIGGVVGLSRRKPLTPARESLFQVLLGVFAVFYGLRLTWISLNGTAVQIVSQLVMTVVALMLGKLIGQALHLQKFSNSLGQRARENMASAGAAGRLPGAGFKTCAILFCAAPLGVLGAIQDGLANYPYALIVKAVMDGLASMAFAQLFGWGVLLSMIPVLAFQGTISLLSMLWLAPFLRDHGLVDPINATGGLLVFSVALVILKLKKIELADYLPALVMAPLISAIFR